MGVTLWERPDLYIGNSPIFKINKVTIPILIRHNKGDENVPWMQSVEFLPVFDAFERKRGCCNMMMEHMGWAIMMQKTSPFASLNFLIII